jgi:molecular chaperone GrpE
MNTETVEKNENVEAEESTEPNQVVESSDTSHSTDQNSTENPESKVELTREEILELDLKKVKEEAENYKDSWQRERAEFVNYKKRTAFELLNSRKEAVRQFIHDLLHPLDNLELVSNVKTENVELKAFVDGVAMVKKEFIGIMDREGVKKMEPIGEVFDPMTMEAISSEESDEYKEEIVIEVFQPGYYFLDGEVKHSIRPARVKVGKPS